MFIAKCIRGNKWIAVNLTRFMYIVSVRYMRKEFNFHALIVNSGLLFINIEKLCHNFGCCFLRNLSRELNLVPVGFLVSYCSHFDVLLTACHIFYLNHDKCFL